MIASEEDMGVPLYQPLDHKLLEVVVHEKAPGMSQSKYRVEIRSYIIDSAEQHALYEKSQTSILSTKNTSTQAQSPICPIKNRCSACSYLHPPP